MKPSTKVKILKLMLELQSRGIQLVEPEAVRYYLLAEQPETYLSYDSAKRGVRRSLNELAKDGYLEKKKLDNLRTLYVITCLGVQMAKECY